MQASDTTQANKTASPVVHPQARALSTVRQFSEKYPAFSQGSLRNLIFLAGQHYTSKGKIHGNGLEMALVRIGRKLLIDDEKFFVWLEKQQVARV
jgi:hypothetical protein